MNVEDLLDKIVEILEEGKHSIVNGGKVKVDETAIRELIEEIRLNMPNEVIQARQIANERKNILAKADSAAELKIKQAEIQARKMVEENEITKAAQVQSMNIIADAKTQAADIIEKAKTSANEITEHAQKWSSDLCTGASSFVDTIMSESEEILSQSIDDFTKSLNKVRHATQQLKTVSAKKNGNNG